MYNEEKMAVAVSAHKDAEIQDMMDELNSRTKYLGILYLLPEECTDAKLVFDCHPFIGSCFHIEYKASFTSCGSFVTTHSNEQFCETLWLRLSDLMFEYLKEKVH